MSNVTDLNEPWHRVLYMLNASVSASERYMLLLPLLLISMVLRVIGMLQGSLPMTLLMKISTVQSTLRSSLEH